jgi:hypothetical protein
LEWLHHGELTVDKVDAGVPAATVRIYAPLEGHTLHAIDDTLAEDLADGEMGHKAPTLGSV